MNGTTLSVGELVMLASGGPAMVVERFEEAEEMMLVHTVWHSQAGDIRRNSFRLDNLSLVGRLCVQEEEEIEEEEP